jgi:AcrR family transcriptional regulator
VARRRADLRREEILQAAAGVVGRLGFARTRVADVATQLGVSTGLVFYHFETKDRLLSEAFLHAAESDLARLDRAVTGSGRPADRLRAVLRLYAPAGQAAGWTLDIEAWAEALRSPGLREASRRLDRRWRDAIETVIRDGVATGDFDCPDPGAATERIAAMLDGLAVATQVRRSVPRARAARWAFEYAAHQVGVSPLALADGAAHRVTPTTGPVRPAR